jgi:hypothetical protein
MPIFPRSQSKTSTIKKLTFNTKMADGMRVKSA